MSSLWRETLKGSSEPVGTFWSYDSDDPDGPIVCHSSTYIYKFVDAFFTSRCAHIRWTAPRRSRAVQRSCRVRAGHSAHAWRSLAACSRPAPVSEMIWCRSSSRSGVRSMSARRPRVVATQQVGVSQWPPTRAVIDDMMRRYPLDLTGLKMAKPLL